MQGPSSPVVHFIWRDAQPDDKMRAALSRLVARVPSLGRACSMVRMSLTDFPEIPSHVPDEDGEQVMRIFGDQRMEELEALFANGHRPQPGPQRRYRHLTGPDQPQTASSCFGEMIVLRKTAGSGLPIEASLTLTKAARKALMKIAGDNGWMSDMLSGHGAHPHCAFVALPFVNREHADGRLLAAGILLPRAISSQDRRKILRACAFLETINLRDTDSKAVNALGSWNVEIAGFDEMRTTLRPLTWSGPSRTWSTVTPILLDRFPKKNLSTESILASACERVGLPKPVNIEHQPYSTLIGVPPVPEFRLLRSEGDRPRSGSSCDFQIRRAGSGPGRDWRRTLFRAGSDEANQGEPR